MLVLCCHFQTCTKDPEALSNILFPMLPQHLGRISRPPVIATTVTSIILKKQRILRCCFRLSTTTTATATTTTTTATTTLVDDDPHNRVRRNASKFLAVWLRDEPSYFAAGLKKLQITQQNSIYYDSIPSFVRTLKEGPPESLYSILDRMVDAGLHHPEVFESYKQYDHNRSDREKIQARVVEETERLEATQQQQGNLRQQLARERKSSTTVVTPRSSQLELLINANQGHIATIKTRIGHLMKRLTDLVGTMHEARIKEIRTLRVEVCDRVVSVFSQHVADRNRQLLQQYQKLDARTDLTRPPDWFLRARFDRRKIIFHGGPTNSGKTYAALERLKQASRGMYVGPLRLLAVEVYEKLTLSGIYCNLQTGQDSREIPFATHMAATVEMANSMEDFDVVVIDEIQMIEDGERGYAWTRALLGIRCREIHVCGGLEAVNVIKRLAEACGDEFELRSYQRFSKLVVANRSLAKSPEEKGCYSRVEKGDCVVAFSRNDIFAIKREIESTTDHKCCIVYGSLPPATRSEQARRFNDPDSGYDILVATDAIGMGLNLNIKRVILNSIFKYDGSGVIRLGHSAMKQISGRAGRRNSPFPEGEVTTRDPRDMKYLRECLSTDIKPIEKAGLVPTTHHIETFRETLEEYNLSDGIQELHVLLQRFNEMANVKSDYFLCRQDEMYDMARLLAGIDLGIPDKYTMCLCPMNLREKGSVKLMKRFATKLAAGEVCGLNPASIPKSPKNFSDLANLCHLFNELELFMWLQKKFPPGNIMESQLAQSRRDETVRLISQGLTNSDKLALKHCYIQQAEYYRDLWERSTKRKQIRPPPKEESEWH